MHLNILPRLGLIFCCIQQKVHKMSHFGNFNDHNSGSKHNSANDPSHALFELYPLIHFSFEFQKLNFSSVRYPLSSKLFSVKYTFLHKRPDIEILFLEKVCWYVLFPVWSQSPRLITVIKIVFLTLHGQ